MDSAPLLTAEMADMLHGLSFYQLPGTRSALEAIASGRVACHDTQTHVAVQKMTEAEALKKFERTHVNWTHYDAWQAERRGYLAALRDAGVIR